ncbi:lipopolysaccharide biosynthesis protein [Sedimenticola sp.]|uniref:lipopolysaccharide biosynthesis protein n=1 Tax=Sedimenticola sp. TaxID=1940285 RepID=UPI003D150F09
MNSYKSVGNAAVYLAANVIVAVIQFGIVPVLTRMMGPENFGMAALYLVTVSLLLPVTGLSLHGLVTVKYFKTTQSELAQLIGVILSIVVTNSLFVVVLAALFGDVIVSTVGLNYYWLSLAVLSALLQSVVLVTLALFQARENPLAYGTVQVGTALTVAAMTLVMTLELDGNWSARVWGHLSGYGVAVLSALYFFNKAGFLVRTEKVFFSNVKECYSFGIPLVPHALGGVALVSAGQMLLASRHGPADVGFYALSMQFGAAFGLMADAFVKAYTPWVFKQLKKQDEESKILVVKGICLAILVFPVLALIFWAMIRLIFDWVVGQGFDEAKPLLGYFCAAGAFVGMYYSVANLYFFTQQTGKLASITITAGVVGIITMFGLGNALGLEGYAAGYLVGQICLFILTWVMSWKYCALPWRNVLFRRQAL